MSVMRVGEVWLKALVAPREVVRRVWWWGEAVVRMVVDEEAGRARRRIWMAEAPTPELPPRTRMEAGVGPVVEPEGRKRSGMRREA